MVVLVDGLQDLGGDGLCVVWSEVMLEVLEMHEIAMSHCQESIDYHKYHCLD